MTELRRLPRWQVGRQGVLKLEQATEELFCQIKDVSFKGAKIALSAKLPEDTRLRINLRFSEDCVINAEVWVVWHKVFNGVGHYGIYFEKICDADKEKIYCFLNKYCYNEMKKKLWPDEERIKEGGEDMNDHRIFERFKKEFSARFISLDGKEKQAQTFDISAKGLGLSTANELEAQAPLEIWLDVPGSTDPLYARGQVVWSRLTGAIGWHSGIELERADFMGISRLLRA